MTNETAAAQRESAIGLEGMAARRQVKRIADRVIDRSIPSAGLLMAECEELADGRYISPDEVYQKVWDRVAGSSELHPTHPAGKTEAYHKLRELAGH